MASIYDWDKTASNNGNSDGDVPWPEGMARRQVNDSARGIMARVAELLGDIAGTLTAGGTANALTVTANSSFTTYANGRVLSFIAASDNTGAATLSVNSIGAKAIRKRGSDGDSALVAGDIQSGAVYTVIYNTALNGGSGAWMLMSDPMSAVLAAIAALTPTDGNFIVGDGSTWVAESGATARASLGLENSSTDNAITRFDGTSGGTQDSTATIDDSGNAIINGNMTVNGTLTVSG